MPTRALASYWTLSRAPRYSVLFAVPLLILYEALAAMLSAPGGAGVRNGADVLLKSLFAAAAGPHGPIVFAVALVGGSIWIIARDMRRSGGALRPRVFAAMFAESVVLALAFGVVIGTITAKLLTPFATLAMAPQPGEMGVATRLMVSLGAGLYEELLFRVLLVSALLAAARRFLGWRTTAATVFAVGAGALIFAAFHYVGPFGDPLRLDSFTFRAIAGVAFSALYVYRGFGITAWTHALYDVFVLVV